MDPPGTSRLAAISPDDHSPWLWVVHVFSLVFVLMGACLRVWMKWRNSTLSDAVLGAAHFVYFGYWMVLLFALINGLGKSENISSDEQRAKASTLVFAARITFVLILSLTKVSGLVLVQEIFTREATKWWFNTILIAATIQAVIGSLLIAVNCSPKTLLEGADNEKCPGNVPRWIAFTVLEAILEALLVIPVIAIVMNLQTSLPRKAWAMTVFICRLIIWVPLWLHLSLYIQFLQHGRPSIDVVPSMITEEIWVALAIVSSSVPVLMRVAKRFTTGGVAFASGSRYAYGYASKQNSFKSSKQHSSRQNSTVQRQSSGFRPDGVDNSIQIDAHMMRNLNTAVSVGSNAESHVGILRHVDFHVSSEDR